MANDPRESKKEKQSSTASKFSITADHIQGATQAERIDNLTQNFGDAYNATVKGSGAAAQGPGSTAVGKGGVAITGDGNTVNTAPKHGGIRAGTLYAKNVVDGIQARGENPARLAGLVRDVQSGGVSADRIDAENVVSGLQVIDDPDRAGMGGLAQEIEDFIGRLRGVLDAGLIPGAGNAEDANTDLTVLQSECGRSDPDMGRMIRKLADLSGILSSAVASPSEPNDRLVRLARQAAALLTTTRNLNC